MVIWLAPVLLAVHNLEEAIAFETYLARVPSLLPPSVAPLASRLSYPAMLTALVIVTILGVVVAALATREPSASWGMWLLLVIEATMAVNAAAHLTSAVVLFRGYGPGLVTAVLVNAPFAWYCFRRASREQWVGKRALRATMPAALLLHGPVLAGGLWVASLTS